MLTLADLILEIEATVTQRGNIVTATGGGYEFDILTEKKRGGDVLTASDVAGYVFDMTDILFKPAPAPLERAARKAVILAIQERHRAAERKEAGAGRLTGSTPPHLVFRGRR